MGEWERVTYNNYGLLLDVLIILYSSSDNRHKEEIENSMKKRKYDIAVSYASEQRTYIERFVKRLMSNGLMVYYDRNEKTKMVGKILDQELHRIYIDEAINCALFLSNEYINKPITKYESQIILSQSLYKAEYMYIFKFDESLTIPGLNRNFVYSSIKEYPEPEQYADFMYEVIRGKTPSCDVPDFLYTEVAEGLKRRLEHYAALFTLKLQVTNQTNKKLMRLKSGNAVLLQLQISHKLGNNGICLWLNKTQYACDDNAYQGYIEWCPANCNYVLENSGLLCELAPKIEFKSTSDIIDRIDNEIKLLIGG